MAHIHRSPTANASTLPDHVVRAVEKGSIGDEPLQLSYFFSSSASLPTEPTVWHLACERGDASLLSSLHGLYSSLLAQQLSKDDLSLLHSHGGRASAKPFSIPDRQVRALPHACQRSSGQSACVTVHLAGSLGAARRVPAGARRVRLAVARLGCEPARGAGQARPACLAPRRQGPAGRHRAHATGVGHRGFGG